jgi:hypothetical protein
VAKVTKGADDAVITPTRIFLGQADNQLLDFGLDGWPPGSSVLRAVELLGDQPPMPIKDGSRFDDGSDLLESPPAEFFADLGQGDPFSVGEEEPSFDLTAKDSVLGGEVLVSFEQLLVHRPSDEGKQCLPAHHAVYAPSAPRSTPVSLWDFPSVNAGFEIFDRTAVPSDRVIEARHIRANSMRSFPHKQHPMRSQ